MLAPVNSPETVAQFFNSEKAKARAGEQSLMQLFSAAEVLNTANQARLTAELYKNWIAFNEGNDLAYMAYFNLAVILRNLDDHAGAINALSECSRLKPDFHQARINLGRVYEDCGHVGKAIDQWKRGLEGLAGVTPESVGLKLLALQQMGRVLENNERLEAAENILKQAMELRPERADAIQHWIALRQRQCKWPVVVASEIVTNRQLLDGISPMSLALHSDDPLLQLAKAHKYNKGLVGRPKAVRLWTDIEDAPDGSPRRLRIGYVSSDLREHAVGFALVELFELHDKSKFEIFAYYFGEMKPADETQARFRAAVDHWTDITRLDDDQAAAEIAEDKIDILVDLNGYTKNARAGIFARRPAPVIVNWCGYPGTLGSPFHQYLIADNHIVPPENEIFFSEKVLRLSCNQPLDRKRKIAEAALTRADEGLPEHAFVFCCLNGMQKITQEVFSIWMQILTEVPDSALWLLSDAPEVEDRLREHARSKGVASERLCFAKKRANAQHLGRIALADLFLDTFPYGAHSTAADALTMCVPVLTRPGRSFASRFCASVVRAAGLDDLVCGSVDDYLGRAIAIGRDRGVANSYRQKLRSEREKSALRDMNGSARRLEELYLSMQSDRAANALPVPDLTNLDVYYEIGAELGFERISQLGDSAFLEAYRNGLSEWNLRSPLPFDSRLWRR